ncbi:MAG TPA: endolytic transglycosylase MltG, partial [Actinomycetota bacterium]|nr:endolytic transglycosylase MltG [Actinomycetota bacterium]
PGLDSLRAALAPAQTDAIYYVVIDRSGKHGFAATNEEFNRLRRQCPPELCGRR